MSVWKVSGGNKLYGDIRIQGSKNAVLPIMAASILAGCETEIINCPQLSDVEAAMEILRHLGCRAEREGDIVNIDSHGMTRTDIPRDLMHEMRSSVIFLGAILARTHEAQLMPSMPISKAAGKGACMGEVFSVIYKYSTGRKVLQGRGRSGLRI